MYKEFFPHELLSPYIDRYWVTQEFLPEKQKSKIPADGCVDIIFASGEAAKERYMQDHRPYLVGTMNTYSEEAFVNEVFMIGVRFKPCGITAFIRTPVFELTNKSLELSLAESIFDKEFHLSFQNTEIIQNRLAYIDNYLLNKLSRLYETDKRIIYACDRIKLTGGLISVKEIASGTCLSLRQFERRFKCAVGISPKTFNRIVRVKNTQKYIKNNPNLSLFSIAVDCGYYDHAHLSKEFNILTGKSPTFS